jgi:voltage-gated potassium channel Kch
LAEMFFVRLVIWDQGWVRKKTSDINWFWLFRPGMSFLGMFEARQKSKFITVDIFWLC